MVAANKEATEIMIDWLSIAKRPASLISAKFRTRTSCTINKNYTEIREWMNKPRQRHATATEKAWRIR